MWMVGAQQMMFFMIDCGQQAVSLQQILFWQFVSCTVDCARKLETSRSSLDLQAKACRLETMRMPDIQGM
jgi:hypothetical protein